MRWAMFAGLLCLSTTLLAPSAAQEGPGPIEHPVWLTRPAMGQLLTPTRQILLDVGLRCRVVAGALANCVNTADVPTEYVEAAIRAAAAARLAVQDSDGLPTEGREITVQIGFPLPVAIDPPAAPPNPSVLTGMNWIARPAAADYARLYPPRAMDNGVSGRVVLDCLVDGQGALSCAVVSEDPPGYGFGNAALRLAQSFRAAPQTTDGRPTGGGRVRVPITWRIG